MNIRQLSRKIQELLEDGICRIVIYKVGKSWFYDDVWSWEDDINYDDEMKIKEAMKKDQKAIVVDGWNNFAVYTLDYIQFQVNLPHL